MELHLPDLATRIASITSLSDLSPLVGHEVRIVGASSAIRSLGKICFIDLQDQFGNVQIVIQSPELIAAVRRVQGSAIFSIEGIVRGRPSMPSAKRVPVAAYEGANRDYEIAATRIKHASDVSLQCLSGPNLSIERLRSLMYASGFVEDPDPYGISFEERQAARRFALHAGNDGFSALSADPPLHLYAKRRATEGYQRSFALLPDAEGHPGLLYFSIAFPQPGEADELILRSVHALIGDLASTTNIPRRHYGDPVPRRAEAMPPGTLEWFQICPILESSPGGTAMAGHAFFCKPLEADGDIVLGHRYCLFAGEGIIADYCLLSDDPLPLREQLSQAPLAPSLRHRLRDLPSAPCPPLLVGVVAVTRILAFRSDPVGTDTGAVASIAKSSRTSTAPKGKPLGQAMESLQLIEAYGELDEAYQKALVAAELAATRNHRGNALDPDASTQALDIALPAFERFCIPEILVKRMVRAIASIEPESPDMDAVELFQTAWSIVGNPSARQLLGDDALYATLMGTLISLRIITDRKQLLYIHPSCVPSIRALIGNPEAATSETPIIKVMRSLLAKRPSEFTTLIDSLRLAPPELIERIDDPTPLIDTLLASQYSTPQFFRVHHERGKHRSARNAIRDFLLKATSVVLPNQPIDFSELKRMLLDGCERSGVAGSHPLRRATEEEIAAEAIYHFFRPVTLSYRDLRSLLTHLEDRCADVAAAGITNTAGAWDPATQSYRYVVAGREGLTAVRFYLSKNRASFFAKSSAGICTDTNLDLFYRPDHLHLNIYCEGSARIVGNVQLYAMSHGERRRLLIRGINPSSPYLSRLDPRDFLDIVVRAVVSIAECNGFDGVVLCERRGLWNANSSRSEIRAAISARQEFRNETALDQPLMLYNYYGLDIDVKSAIALWSRH